MDLDLRDRVVVVTGATAGIGRATAVELAREGAIVVAGARSHQGLQALQDEVSALGPAPVTVAGDLTSAAGVAALAKGAHDRAGRIDGLVACVGSTPLGDFDEIDDDIWQQAFTGKFLASVRAVRAVLPHMREQGSGRIVVVAGNTAHGPAPWMATSGAMNAALVNLVASTSQLVAAEGIGVNCLSPGPTDTARYQGLRATVMRREGEDLESAEGIIRAQIPGGRVGQPAEVGRLAVILVSPASAHVNGANLVVDAAQTSPI